KGATLSLCELFACFSGSAWQDARLYGRRDSRRYHIGDVGVDGRKPILPVTAQMSVQAEGDIVDINTSGFESEPGPGLARLAIRFNGPFQKSPILRVLVEGKEHAAPQFPGEEASNMNLNRD